MIVGSDNSTRSIFSAMPRVSVSVFGEGKYEKSAGDSVNAAPTKTDDQLLAELYDRTAQQMLDHADINGDGRVSKDEYMASQKRLADADNRVFDPDETEERWAKFDPDGKGAVGKDEIIEGLKVVLPLNVGHFGADVADRIRGQALEASKEALQNFQDAIEAEKRKPAMAETIKTTIAEQASLLSLYDEFK